MELKKGDIVVTTWKVEKIKAILGRLKKGEIGVIFECDIRVDGLNVYGVVINEKVYYLFEDEINILED